MPLLYVAFALSTFANTDFVFSLQRTALVPRKGITDQEVMFSLDRKQIIFPNSDRSLEIRLCVSILFPAGPALGSRLAVKLRNFLNYIDGRLFGSAPVVGHHAWWQHGRCLGTTQDEDIWRCSLCTKVEPRFSWLIAIPSDDVIKVSYWIFPFSRKLFSLKSIFGFHARRRNSLPFPVALGCQRTGVSCGRSRRKVKIIFCWHLII